MKKLLFYSKNIKETCSFCDEKAICGIVNIEKKTRIDYCARCFVEVTRFGASYGSEMHNISKQAYWKKRRRY